jgi:hypothetical protein
MDTQLPMWTTVPLFGLCLIIYRAIPEQARRRLMRQREAIRSLGWGMGGRDRRASDAVGIPTTVSGQLRGKPSHGRVI